MADLLHVHAEGRTGPAASRAPSLRHGTNIVCAGRVLAQDLEQQRGPISAAFSLDFHRAQHGGVRVCLVAFVGILHGGLAKLPTHARRSLHRGVARALVLLSPEPAGKNHEPFLQRRRAGG